MSDANDQKAIARRLLLRKRALQDRALELRRAGGTNREVGIALGVETRQAERLADAASCRHELMKRSEGGCDLEALSLTKPETLLLEALTKETFSLMDSNERRSCESRNVAWWVRRSQGWVSATARKRIGRRVVDPVTKKEVPGLGLVDVRGNGYLNITDEGLPVCRALFPEEFAA